MRILVCDDAPEELNAISIVLMNCSYVNSCSVNGFQRPQDMLYYFEDGYEADLVFLDILMPHMTGIELAGKLRRLGYSGFIVFLSAINDYAIETYGVEAFSYLVKPAQQQEVQELINKIETVNRSPKNAGFKIKSNGRIRFIRFSELIYAEVRRRHLYFHLSDGETVEICGSLSDYAHILLTDSRMSWNNRSFILNMDYIRHCEGGAVYLKDNTRISIPQNFSEFQRNYFNWMFGKKY